MKLVSNIICPVVASAALLFTGCTKKPDRPAPSQTVLGQPTGPAPASQPPPMPVDFNPNAPLLQPRSDFDPNGENRVALQGKPFISTTTSPQSRRRSARN